MKKYIYLAYILLAALVMGGCSDDSATDGIARPGDKDYGDFAVGYSSDADVYYSVPFSVAAEINNPDDYIINILMDTFTYADVADEANEMAFATDVMRLDGDYNVVFAKSHPFEEGKEYVVKFDYQLYKGGNSEMEYCADNSFKIVPKSLSQLVPAKAYYLEKETYWTISNANNSSVLYLVSDNDVQLNNNLYTFELLDCDEYFTIDSASGVLSMKEELDLGGVDKTIKPSIRVTKTETQEVFDYSGILAITLTENVYPDEIRYEGAPFFFNPAKYATVQKVGGATFGLYQRGVKITDWASNFVITKKPLDNPNTILDESALITVQPLQGNLWSNKGIALVEGEELRPTIVITSKDGAWSKAFVDCVTIYVTASTPPMATALSYETKSYEWESGATEGAATVAPAVTYADNGSGVVVDDITYRYSLDNCTAQFVIDSETGVVSLNPEYTFSDKAESYNPWIKVEIVKDEAVLSTKVFYTALEINILNSAIPSFDVLSYESNTYAWSFDTTEATSAASVTFVDKAGVVNPETITYSLLDCVDVLEIDSATGAISVKAEYVQSTGMEVFKPQVYVSGSNGGEEICNKTFSDVVEITLTNSAVPAIETLSYATADYTWSVGSTESTVAAAIDYFVSDSQFESVTYSLGSFGDAFDIDPATGVITLKSTYTQAQSSYVCKPTVIATGVYNGAQTAKSFESVVTITLTYVDTDPYVTYSPAIVNVSQGGVLFAMPTLTFKDGYAFNLKSNTSMFSDNSATEANEMDYLTRMKATGVTIFAGGFASAQTLPIGAELVPIVNVVATGSTTAAWEGTPVTLVVTEVPEIEGLSYPAASYSLECGTTIATEEAVVSFTEVDAVAPSNFVYTLDEASAEIFNVTSKGVISLKDTYTQTEASKEFKVGVTVSANGWKGSAVETLVAAKTFAEVVTINVTPAVVIPPTTTPEPTITEFTYGAANAWKVGAAYSTAQPTYSFDADGYEGTVTYDYSLVDPTQTLFTLDSATGVVSIAAESCVEANIDEYTISVKVAAMDSESVELCSATSDVIISIVAATGGGDQGGSDDTAAAITALTYATNNLVWLPSKDLSSEAPVVTFEANESGVTSEQLTYSYELVDCTDQFTIDPATGVISLVTTYIPATAGESHAPQIKVSATKTEGGESVCEATIAESVTITFPTIVLPSIQKWVYAATPYTFTVGGAENSTGAVQEVVFKTDPTVVPDTFTYSLKSNNDVFAIDSATGEVTLKADYTQEEDAVEYSPTINVQARYNGCTLPAATMSTEKYLKIIVNKGDSTGGGDQGGSDDEFTPDNTYMTCTPAVVEVSRSATSATISLVVNSGYDYVVGAFENADTAIVEKDYVEKITKSSIVFKDLTSLNVGDTLIPRLKVKEGTTQLLSAPLMVKIIE